VFLVKKISGSDAKQLS
ncbi:hypothetical protein E2320_004545, partial [Naja naja]